MVAYVIYYIYNSIPCLCVSFLSIKDYIGNKMAQWVKALVTKPNDLTLTPGTNTEEGENQCLQSVLTSAWAPRHEHSHIHTLTYTK